ncbi:MAG: sigma-70 family RNA polymerase sigma factor [Planctomycetota bacterium]
MNNLSEPDDEYFVALIASSQPLLRTIIRSMLPGSNACEDILQETNMVLWRKQDAFDRGTRFEAWAATIARLQVLAWCKKNRQDKTCNFDEKLLERIASVAHVQLNNLSDRREALRYCLKQLSKANRELIEYRYFQKRRLVDFASSQQRSLAAVTKTLERLRGKLRDCINRRISLEVDE